MSFQAIVDPYARADFFLSSGRTGASTLEEGFITLHDAAGRAAREGRQAARRLRQGQPDAQPRAAVDRSAADDREPGRRRGRHRGRRALGVAPDSRTAGCSSRRPARSTGASRRSSSAPTQQRPDLRRPAARLPGHQRGVEHRPRRVVRVRAQRRRRRTAPRGSSGSMRRSATGRCGGAIYRRFLARTEMVWSRRSELAGEPQSFGAYVSGDYQFAAAGSPACASTTRTGRPTRR